MCRIRAALPAIGIWLAGTIAVYGQEFPAVYEVTGVASGDVLNIRAQPSSRSADIGDLAPGVRVEVTGLDDSGNWARVAGGEGDGWVFAEYLTEVEAPALDSGMPLSLWCSGTEPFWAAEIDSDAVLHFQEMDGASLNVPVHRSAASANSAEAAYAFEAPGFVGVVRREECSDGMSDRTYGWSINLIETMRGQLGLRSGCCMRRF